MSRRELLLKLFQSCNNAISVAQLHSLTLKCGVIQDNFFSTKLISFYAEYSSLQPARTLFEEMPRRSLYQYNTLLRWYGKDKHWEDILVLFRHMISHGIGSDEKPDSYTVPIILKACVGLRRIEYGKMVHGFVKKNGTVEFDVFVCSSLIEFYSKCGEVGETMRLFEEFDRPDVVMWTSLISACEQNGYPDEAIMVFSKMVRGDRFNPDRVSLISLISACVKLSNFELGRSIHGFVIRRGLERDLSLANSLLNLYAKNTSLKFVANLFEKMPEKDVISRSLMIACYAKNGASAEALELFSEMVDKRLELNEVTIVNVLQACSSLCNIEDGRKIHKLVCEKGFDSDVLVATALIDMYMSCKVPDQAFDVFTRMPEKDVVAWGALISGYAQNSMCYECLEVFHDMLLTEFEPDGIVIVKVLAACSELGVYRQAISIHSYVIRKGFEHNCFISASLIELYSKCGSLEYAIKVFKEIGVKDVVTWSAMIAGYGIHGNGVEALKTFDKMIKSSSTTRPNNVTFQSLLSACSHSGLIKEGIKIFDSMVNSYKLVPDSKHYAILVDLLGRTGELNIAMSVIQHMPIAAGPDVWGALLGSCKIHQNVQVGEKVAKTLLDLDSNHAGYYILLSNMYSFDRNWYGMEKVRAMIKDKKMEKNCAQSSVEVKEEVHSFVADDNLHPESVVVYKVLRKLGVHMRTTGLAE